MMLQCYAHYKAALAKAKHYRNELIQKQEHAALVLQCFVRHMASVKRASMLLQAKKDYEELIQNQGDQGEA